MTINYGVSSTNYQTVNHTFTINYTKNGNSRYNAKNYFSFKGAEYVKITIQPVTLPTIGSFNTKNVLVLQNEMRVTRTFSLSNGVLPLSLSASTPPPGADEAEITWSWPSNAGNTGFQLEWTWLDDDLASTYHTNGTVDPNLLFIRNSTPVDLPSNRSSYKIPLLYGSLGKLYYRIRATNFKANGNRVDGPWSPTQNIPFGGHENSLNWQAATSFAEEGKRKAVMQYFDGSLRNRQTITKENSTNTTIASETFYDFQGRPAIQVLPSPGLNNVIQYHENLNQFNNGAGVVLGDPATHFDLQPVPTNSFTLPLDNGSGASKYYSGENSEKTNGANAYIPDAERYPYTLTRYTPDATGRIKSQTGVGAAMQAGKGHETKYYYGNPSQEELDGLFGTEVGNATHYFKNMILDPNGQMSVSYVDMSGRTIATALAGAAPTSLQALNLNSSDYPNQSGTTLTRKLLDGNTNNVRNNSIEAVNSLLVPATTNYTFNYQLNPQSLQLEQTTGPELCYDCMYDLEISITDESGDNPPIVRRFNNVSLTADDNCATTAPIFKDEATNASSNNISFSQLLSPGSYSVRKTLKLSEASLERYQELYLTKGLGKSEQLIIDSIYNVMQTASGCDAPPVDPCVACTTSLGTLTQFKGDYATSIGKTVAQIDADPQLKNIVESAYKQSKSNCDKLCGTLSPTVDVIRQLMLADMMPFTGQYARKSGNTSDQTYTSYNIFYGTAPAYKNPEPNNRQPLDMYITAFGERDPVNDELASKTPDDFASSFNASWAEGLLKYHPEYPRLLIAESPAMKTAADWLLAFQNTNTYAEAEANGFIFTNATNLIDPLYNSATSLKDAMVAKIKDELNGDANFAVQQSMWQISYAVSICNNSPSAVDISDCIPTAKVPPYTNLTTAQKDQLWKVFKSQYLSEREEDLKSYINSQAPSLGEIRMIANGYILRFPSSNSRVSDQVSRNSPAGNGWVWYRNLPGHPTAIFGEAADELLAGVSAGWRCDNYIEKWKQTLEQCPALQNHPNKVTILNEITWEMREVCRKGIDQSNPYGSSTVAPSTPTETYRSFEEVIDAKFLEYGIAKTNLCNPFIIEYPKPYFKGPAFVREYATTADTCTCSRFAQLKSAAAGAGYNANQRNTLNQYLSATYGDTLTQVLYDGLVNNCSLLLKTECVTSYKDSSIADTHPIPCGWLVSGGHHPPGETLIYLPIKTCTNTTEHFPLPYPQRFPEFLKCGFVPVQKCLSCAQLSQLVTEFKGIIPSPFNGGPNFSNAELSEADLANNVLFAQFVNFRTGFSYSWRDYAATANSASCNLANYTANNNAHQQVVCMSDQVLTDPTDFIESETPCQKVYRLAINMGQEIYRSRTETLLHDFAKLYREKCLSAAAIEQFTVTYTNKEYHYTLYYYDMAGNLVKTVPPKGVNPDFSTSFTNSVKTARANNEFLPRQHTYITNYRYNSLDQVVAQRTPDAGSSYFWYDRLGRLAVSQNSKQVVVNKYSYTLYDDFGRIQEVGQKPQSSSMSQTISQDPIALQSWIAATGGVREEITETGYDLPFEGGALLAPYDQSNLRNRVSYSTTKKLYTDVSNYSATIYSYDVHGNVDKLVHDFEGITAMTSTGNRYKYIRYKYDLISGKVNSVHYQPNEEDQFNHRYTYDSENRLVAVETSRDNIIWERDAAYNYYKHGPLSRLELGQLRVQGLDYAYTLQGWLKGINGTGTGDGQYDMGKDGYASGANSVPGRDVLGLALHYYDAQSGSDLWQDYKPIDQSTLFARPGANATLKSLYNGNIGAMSVNLGALKAAPSSNVNSAPLLYNYQYDQLNRLVSMQAYQGLNTATNQWSAISINDYAENVSYDPNGNIVTYNRNGAPATGRPQAMDHLNYEYFPGTNQLLRVGDNASLTSNYGLDVDVQPANNYTYDLVGNLIGDASAGIPAINWTVYGKIASIVKGSSTIDYGYDAAGNRISKKVGNRETIYVRDATGNTMSVYEYETGGLLKQKEQWLYGATRIGLQAEHKYVPINVPLSGSYGSATVDVLSRGEKFFELSNHLGNVMATISDRKLARDLGGDGTIDYNNADVTSAQDYYPFGMLMPGRMFGVDESVAGGTVTGTTTVNGHTVPSELYLSQRTGAAPSEYAAASSIEFVDGFESGSTDDFVGSIADDSYAGTGNQGGGSGTEGNAGLYRYGFNGKENDDEVKGTGNTLDFSGRIYDSRIGRWSSLDPVIKPWLSQYQFGGNNPANNIDPDGKDEIHFHYYTRSIVGSNGVRTGSTSARIEIIKTNGPDRFFHHSHVAEFKLPTNYSSGGSATWEKTTEFYPWKPESRSGLTSTSFMGLYSRTDRDYATLMKYATASPALKKYFEERSNDPSAGQFNQSAYQGLLSDMSLYNGLRKVQEYSELTAAVLSIAEGGLALRGAGAGAPTLPSRLTRVIPEEYAGAKTLGRPGELDVFVADAAELKGLTSEQIAQKLTLVEKNGQFIKGPFRLIEFDAPSSGLAQPLNRSNPGFINGGKTAGGATEYVIPNFRVSELKNVTQTTVK